MAAYYVSLSTWLKLVRGAIYPRWQPITLAQGYKWSICMATLMEVHTLGASLYEWSKGICSNKMPLYPTRRQWLSLSLLPLQQTLIWRSWVQTQWLAKKLTQQSQKGMIPMLLLTYISHFLPIQLAPESWMKSYLHERKILGSIDRQSILQSSRSVASSHSFKGDGSPFTSVLAQTLAFCISQTMLVAAILLNHSPASARSPSSKWGCPKRSWQGSRCWSCTQTRPGSGKRWSQWSGRHLGERVLEMSKFR